MTSEAKPTQVLYENLDTSFVNLWALLRYLSQRSFIGRVHVELDNYSADVFVNGSETPLVREVDRDAGTDVVEEAALHRLVLRVRESSGAINVYEGAAESIPPQIASAPAPAESTPDEPPPAEPPPTGELLAATPEARRSSEGKDEEETVVAADAATVARPGDAAEWGETVRVTSELVGAVERAGISMGANFEALFREARISFADDYPFLDPMTGEMRYENSSVSMNGESQPEGYVDGVTAVLRRVIDQLATGDRERRTRERIALELARVARKNSAALERSGFSERLDGIAKTKVI